MADFFGSGSNQPMPSFNLITTRPISKSRWIRSLIFGPTKKTSPHSVPPSAGNSLYRIPFCLKPQQKKNTKSTSNCSSKLHLTFGQIKTIGHIEKDSLWIDGFGNWNVAWLRTKHHGANTSDSPGKSMHFFPHPQVLCFL